MCVRCSISCGKITIVATSLVIRKLCEQLSLSPYDPRARTKGGGLGTGRKRKKGKSRQVSPPTQPMK